MIQDIATVLWKEIRELLAGGGRRSKLSILVFAAVFGVMLPLQSGRSWVESPLSLFFWAWMPFLMVSSVIADSIAGERERHTLETLLASRLPDRAILLGKTAAAVTYGVGLAWFILLVGLITVNIAFGAGKLIMYAPAALAVIAAVSILGAGLSTGVGILVSLRAPTVRQAQQTMSVAMLVVFVLPIIALQFLSAQTLARIAALANGMNLQALVIGMIAVLLAADTALILAALARFKRARLILD
ncbi:MAG: ABC transporter permease [Anaerolineae bacterium]